MKSLTSLAFLALVSEVVFVTGNPFPSNEDMESATVWALTAFKKAIYEDPNLVLSNWNVLDADPCKWNGISCSQPRDHVVKLNISGSSLRGCLAPELGRISYLQELILHGNNLIGVIPKELGMLKNLKLLDLGMNQLTGPIPPEIGNLTTIQKIILQSNGLTGNLPSELSNLRNLQELRLDRNKLQGSVPASGNLSFTSKMHGRYTSTDLCQSSQLKAVDFSYNFLVGSIPKCLDFLPRSSFQGNCFENEDVKQRPTAQCAQFVGNAASPPVKNHSGSTTKHQSAADVSKDQTVSKPIWHLALEIVTGTLVGSFFLVAVLTTFHWVNSRSSIIIPWKKSTCGKDNMTVYMDSELLKDVVRYSRQELEVACEDFSNIIGSLPSSMVYKGNFSGGSEIAAISLCIKEEQWTGYLELNFQTEVAELARLNHEHTGKLLGYCRESNPFTRMLVFEYASNGTLYEHLHYGDGCQLSWTRRMKIVLGIARGLKYLHTEIDPPFTISELNSSCVYITEDFSPKLVDFESWKTVLERSEMNSEAICNQGAIYVLPNSTEARRLDIRGNVYAFGVLLLEIISGRPPYCKGKGYLVDWAKEYLELPEVVSYAVDPELKHFGYEDLKVICEVVNLCIHSDSANRPSMQEICDMLESRIDTSMSIELKSSSAWAELAQLT